MTSTETPPASAPGSPPAPRLVTYLKRPLSFSRNAQLYLAGSLLMGLGHGAVWVHLNLYYRALGLGEATIGRILAAGALGTVVVALPAALFADRLPPARVFVLAAVGFSLALATQLAFGHPLLLGLAAAFTHALFTVHWVAAAPFFARNSTERDRLDLFSFAMALETLATVVSSAGVGLLAQSLTHVAGSELNGIRFALLAAAAAALLAVIPFVKIRSAPAGGRSPRAVREYLTASDWPLLARLTLPSALIGAGAGLIIPFLNLYFRDRFNQPPGAIGAFFAVSQLLTMLGYLAGPPLARRVGLVRTVVGTELGSIPFFFLLAVAQDLRLAVFAFWMRAALMNMNNPVATSFTMSVVSEKDLAVTNSVRMFTWNIAWMVSTQVGGILIERHGYAVPMVITMTFYAIAAAFFYGFFHRMHPAPTRVPIEGEPPLG